VEGQGRGASCSSSVFRRDHAARRNRTDDRQAPNGASREIPTAKPPHIQFRARRRFRRSRGKFVGPSSRRWTPPACARAANAADGSTRAPGPGRRHGSTNLRPRRAGLIRLSRTEFPTEDPRSGIMHHVFEPPGSPGFVIHSPNPSDRPASGAEPPRPQGEPGLRSRSLVKERGFAVHRPDGELYSTRCRVVCESSRRGNDSDANKPVSLESRISSDHSWAFPARDDRTSPPDSLRNPARPAPLAPKQAREFMPANGRVAFEVTPGVGPGLPAGGALRRRSGPSRPFQAEARGGRKKPPLSDPNQPEVNRAVNHRSRGLVNRPLKWRQW